MYPKRFAVVDTILWYTRTRVYTAKTRTQHRLLVKIFGERLIPQ